MPELPDLQNFAANLHSIFTGKKLLTVEVVKAKNLKDTEADLKKNLEGQVLKKVYRDGKELRFLFSNNILLGMHLMLHGELHIYNRVNEQKHTIIQLDFDNGKGLALTDWQARANIKLNPINKAGVDALSNGITHHFLTEKLKRKKKIKDLLKEQDVIRGIGNAYADEILWHARISPFSIASALPERKIKDLAKAVKTVLQNAIKQINKSHPGIISGEVRHFLVIHNSKLKESPTGSAIKVEKKGSGTTYYTDEQELFQ